MSSIFNIERRADFQSSFAKFRNDLDGIVTSESGKNKIFDYLNHCIRFWPYRCGATGMEDYLRDINVDLSNPQNDRDRLLILELWINLLHWAPEQDVRDDKSDDFVRVFSKSMIEDESERLLDNAKYILEQCCNMMIREEQNDVFSRYYITKRNMSVDAAAASVPKLSDVLLGYFDIRNEDNLEVKETALTAIYAYMEPHRREYRSSMCGTIAEEFFASMNTFGIRHNTESQKKLSVRKKKTVCDKLFWMAVFILQMTDVNAYRDELKALREKDVRT